MSSRVVGSQSGTDLIDFIHPFLYNCVIHIDTTDSQHSLLDIAFHVSRM